MRVSAHGMAIVLVITTSATTMWNCTSKQESRHDAIVKDSLSCAASYEFPQPRRVPLNVAVDTLGISVLNSCDKPLYITIDIEQWLDSRWQRVSDDVFSPPMFMLKFLTVAGGGSETVHYPLRELHHESLVRYDTTRDTTLLVRFVARYSFGDRGFESLWYSPRYFILWPKEIHQYLGQWHEIERMKVGE